MATLSHKSYRATLDAVGELAERSLLLYPPDHDPSDDDWRKCERRGDPEAGLLGDIEVIAHGSFFSALIQALYTF